MAASLFSLDLSLKKTYLFLGGIISFACTLFILPGQDTGELASFAGTPFSLQRSYPSFKGILAKKERVFTASFPDLRNELEVLLSESRPDGLQKGVLTTVLLKRSRERRQLLNGEKLPLTYRSQEGRSLLSFGEPALLFISTNMLSVNKIEFKVELADSHQELVFLQKDSLETFQLVPKKEAAVDVHELLPYPAFKTLAAAKCWGGDQYLAVYSPGEALAERLEMEGPEGAYFCSVREPVLLFFEKGKWQPVNQTTATDHLPIARIRSRSAKMLELEGWDEKGKYFLFSLPLLSGPPLKIRMEEVLTQPRLRTWKQMSCFIEKERFFFKKGDRIIRSSGKWRVLQEENDLPPLLADTELFVFDGIHQKNGQKTLHGHLFNPMRTEYVQIEIPLRTQKAKPLEGAPTPQVRSRKPAKQKLALDTKTQVARKPFPREKIA